MTQVNAQRYSLGAIIFHWLIAIAVIVNWRIAEAAEVLEGAERGALIGNHKALGIIILVLTLMRLAWRFSHRPPPHPDSMAGWEKFLSGAVHTIFYVLLIGLPIGGWVAGSFASSPVDMFGAFTLPMLPVEQNYDIAGAVIGFHGTAGEAMLILIGLHILGALKHTFYDKVGGLKRMWPGSG